MKKIQWFLASVWVCFAFALSAQSAVKQLRSNSLKDRLQIVIDVDNKPEFNVFVLSNPVRLVIDVKGKAHANYRNALSFKNRGVTKVRSGKRSDSEIRFVFDLNYDYHWEVYDLPPGGRYGHRIVLDVYDIKLKPTSTVATKMADQPNKQAVATNAIVLESTNPLALESPVDQVVKQINPSSSSSKPRKVAPVSKPTPTKVITSDKPIVASKKVAKRKTKKPVPQSRLVKPAKKVRSKKHRDIIVMIDPGHGGKDSGALGRRGTKEKNIVLKIGKRLKRKIDAMPGMRAVLTRSRDKYIPLRGRLRLARRHKADLFVSIHADSFVRPTARGSSVFILSTRGASSETAKWLANKENSVDLKYGVDIGDYDRDVSKVLMQIQLDATIESSNILAKNTLMEMKKISKLHKRYVERAGFVVLKSPDIPSMLVETAFISNPEEEKRLRSPVYRDKMASAIAKGIRKYFDQHLPHHLLLIDAPK